MQNTLTHSSVTIEEVSLPGHNRVSSLSEVTVSRDDSIVVALPSNILPGKTKENKTRAFRDPPRFDVDTDKTHVIYIFT